MQPDVQPSSLVTEGWEIATFSKRAFGTSRPSAAGVGMVGGALSMASSFFSDTNSQLIDVKSSRSELQSSLTNISSDLKTIEKDIGALKGIATGTI